MEDGSLPNVTINVISDDLILRLLKYLKKVKNEHTILVTQKQGFRRFGEIFKTIKAGGGIVYNTEDKLLLIQRNGLWDLPKGKLKKNEPFKEGALREVEEECNVHDLKAKKYLTTSYHIYKEENWCLKETEWYVMTSGNWKDAEPQLEEGITAIRWVDLDRIDISLLGSYSSIKDVLYQLQYDLANNAGNRHRG